MKEIPLTKGYVALVDDGDYARLSKRKWCASKVEDRVYAVSGSRDKKVLMHREVMRAKKGQEIGHRAGMGLDNRRSNLRRFIDRSHQRANDRKRKDNLSGARGVRIVKRKNAVAYAVRVKFHGKEYHGGTFKSLKAATSGYAKKAKELYGASIAA